MRGVNIKQKHESTRPACTACGADMVCSVHGFMPCEMCEADGSTSSLLCSRCGKTEVHGLGYKSIGGYVIALILIAGMLWYFADMVQNRLTGNQPIQIFTQHADAKQTTAQSIVVKPSPNTVVVADASGYKVHSPVNSAAASATLEGNVHDGEMIASTKISAASDVVRDTTLATAGFVGSGKIEPDAEARTAADGKLQNGSAAQLLSALPDNFHGHWAENCKSALASIKERDVLEGYRITAHEIDQYEIGCRAKKIAASQPVFGKSKLVVNLGCEQEGESYKQNVSLELTSEGKLYVSYPEAKSSKPEVLSRCSE